MTASFNSDTIVDQIRQAAAGRFGEFRIDCPGCQSGQTQKETLGINADTGVFHCYRCEIKGNFRVNGKDRKPLAEYIWDRAVIVQRHPYCDLKKIFPEQIRADQHGNWIVPFTDSTGRLQTIQMIDADGEKKFLSKVKNEGRGPTGAAYQIPGAGSSAYICEGPATGHSISQASGAPV